jgi:beta-N-acetylhexosaminidase
MNASHEIPVVKHFPGLGGSSGNTDVAPARTLPWPVLQRVALPPFEAAIAHGAPAVMISNAIVPGLTSGPASLSYKAITTVLKQRLGFKGLVVTDSLSAGAVLAHYTVAQAAVRAVQAGADLVLYGSTGSTAGDLAEARAIDQAIVAAVRSHVMTRSRLDNAVAEILNAEHVSACTAS